MFLVFGSGLGFFAAGGEAGFSWIGGFGFGVELGVFFYAEVVGGLEGPGEDVFGSGGQADVGHAHAAPAAGDRKEDFGEFFNEGLLLVESELEITVALLGGG